MDTRYLINQWCTLIPITNACFEEKWDGPKICGGNIEEIFFSNILWGDSNKMIYHE